MSLYALQMSVAPLTGLNAYVTAYQTIRTGTGFNQRLAIDFVVSNGSVTNYGNAFSVNLNNFTLGGGVRIAYMPAPGGLGRLFATWIDGSLVYVGELELSQDAEGNVSVSSLLQNPSLYGISGAHSAIAMMGNQIVVGIRDTGNMINMTISNDLVASPGPLTFNSVVRTAYPTDASFGVVTVPGVGLCLAWKGEGSNDIGVASYNFSTQTPTLITILYHAASTGLDLTYLGGQMYLGYIGTIAVLNIWPQNDWNTLNPRIIGISAFDVSICPTTDGLSLILGWISSDGSYLLGVSNQPA